MYQELVHLSKMYDAESPDHPGYVFFSNLKCVNMKYNGKEKDWCPELIHEHVIIETYVCI